MQMGLTSAFLIILVTTGIGSNQAQLNILLIGKAQNKQVELAELQ